MINKKNAIFLITFLLINACSFDNKTGIWDGSEEEKRLITEIEKEQNEIIRIEKIYSSTEIYSKEIMLRQNIILSQAKKNKNWTMSNKNNQNFLGNIYLEGADNIYLKKKRGKNKYSISRILASPLVFNNNIIFSDERGTVYNLDEFGKVRWKKNIYKKIYNRIYKNLNFIIHKNIIYISDNVGFIYALNLDTGNLLWIKNHGIPLRSNIKIFENKIFLINQDNRFLCFNIKDGSIIWNVHSIPSFIKVQNFLSLALSKNGQLVGINSSGDLMNIDSSNGRLRWSSKITTEEYKTSTDFFKSSEVVIADNDIILSVGSLTFSFNLTNGYINWRQKVSSVGTPIVDKKNIFFVTNNGYFVIVDRKTGEIISSTNILKILKSRKQNTKITGFIMGSEKVYALTRNGYLIISSATTGKAESFKKIGDPVTSAPIINNGKLYILTENSRILVFG